MNMEEHIEMLAVQHRDMGLTLQNLISMQPSKNLTIDSIPDWGKRRVEVWCRMHNEGGCVSLDRFRELCIKAGYKTDDGDGGLKTKGIGGLFSGGKYAHIQYGTNRKTVFLTDMVSMTVLAWVKFPLDDVAELFK